MERAARCCICGSRITARFWVCAACESAYHLAGAFADWPAWAKALKANEQSERRRAANWREYTIVSLDACPEAERLAYGDANDDRLAG